MIGGVERFFKPGWVVTKKVPVADGMGGFTQSSSSQGSVRGVMRPLSGEYRLSADKLTAFATHRFYCSPSVHILPGRYLSTGGTKYEVKFASDMMSMGRLMQVDCEVIG